MINSYRVRYRNTISVYDILGYHVVYHLLVSELHFAVVIKTIIGIIVT
jgi:hypothetical protein